MYASFVVSERKNHGIYEFLAICIEKASSYKALLTIKFSGVFNDIL